MQPRYPDDFRISRRTLDECLCVGEDAEYEVRLQALGGRYHD
jgi:hypothetical protein